MRLRRAFTLIELLVVMTIMVSLGGMLTYALASAQTDARIKRSEADVLTIGQLLQSRVNEVSLTPVSLVYGPSGLELARQGTITPQAISGPGTGGLTTNARRVSFMAQERARLILLARRDLARMTMPECQADLLYPPASLQFRTYSGTGWLPNVAQIKPPAQWSRMRTMAGLLSAAEVDAQYPPSNPANDPTVDSISEAGSATFEQLLRHDASQPFSAGTPTPVGWTRQHESSECLYLILATTELFGQTAIDKIPASQIADTDNDGVPEILDAWGRPYQFMRNPIGFTNPAIKNFNPSGSTPVEQYPFDPDPFDFLAADLRFDASTHPAAGLPESAFFPVFLPPMVVSAGQDGDFGLRLSFVDADNDGVPEFGVNRGYSASSVQFPNNGYGPVYPTVSIVRYPDPFFNVATVDPTGTDPYVFSIDSIVGAKRGADPSASIATFGGLGTVVNRDAFADNITSLDSGF